MSAEVIGTAELVIRANTQPLTNGLREAERQAEQQGRKIGEALERGQQQGQQQQAAKRPRGPDGRYLPAGTIPAPMPGGAGDGSYRDANGRLRDARGRYIAGGGGINPAAGGAAAGGMDFSNVVEGAAQLASALGIATTALEALLFTFNEVKALDSAAAAFRTLGGDSKELIGNLQALSSELKTNFSTVELAKAAYDVASSGFASAADATEVLRASALGAQAGFSDMNTVGNAVTSVLNAYGLSAKDAGELVDGFIQTQNDGKIVLAQYAGQIGRVAPIAAAAGVGIKDLNAAIAVATAQGVQPESTITGLTQAISAIVNPTDRATKVASDLGLAFNAQALRAKGLEQFLKDMNEATGGSVSKNIALLGGTEALTAIQPLLTEGVAKYTAAREKQNKVDGVAAKAAEENAKTIEGSIKRIQNALSNLTNEVSKNSGVLPAYLGGVASTIDGISSIPTLRARATARVGAEVAGANAQRFSGPGLEGEVTVKYNGKTYTGKLDKIKKDIEEDIFLLLTDPQKLAKKRADEKKEAETAANRKRRLEIEAQGRTDDARDTAQRDFIRPAAERLAIAQRLNGLEGDNLAIAKDQLKIEGLRREEAKLLKELRTLSNDPNDPARIERLGRIQAVQTDIQTAMIEAGQTFERSLKNAAERVKEAAERLRGAQQNSLSARVQGFDLLSDAQQAQVRRQLETQIQGSLRSGSFDPERVAARFGAPFFGGGSATITGPGQRPFTQNFGAGFDTSGLSITQLQELAAATKSLDDANAELLKATRDSAQAQRELNATLQGEGITIRAIVPDGVTVDAGALPVRYQ